MRINLRAVIPALVIGSLAAIPTFATPLNTIDLGVTGGIDVATSTIEFGTTQFGGPYAAPGTQGVFTVTSPIQGIFAANNVTIGEMGMITSLSSVTEPIGTTVTPPIDFMNFNGGGSNLVLYLSQLNAGSTVGPFSLSDTSSGATAAFSIFGEILNKTDGTMNPYEGVFSATFAGLTVSDLEAQAAAGVMTPYSGTFSVTTTPEPASLLLMGVGLLGAGIVARKKVRS